MPTPTPTSSPTAMPAGSAWTSVDLPIAWDDPPSGGASQPPTLADATLGGPGIVAVGRGPRGGEIWTSIDGLAWQRLPPTLLFEGVWIQRIVAWRGTLVAAGFVEGHLALWTSTDGTDWTRAPDRRSLLLPTTRGTWAGVVMRLFVEGDELVAVTRAACECMIVDSVVTWRTTDLVSWQRTVSPWDFELVRPGPIQGGRGLLRVGGVAPVRTTRAGLIEDPWHATIETSVDGLRWRTVYRGADESYLDGVLTYSGGFIAYGDYQGDPLIVTSDDGLDWTTVSWDIANGSFDVHRLLDLDGRLVLLGDRDGMASTAVSPALSAPIAAIRPSEPPGGLVVVDGEWRQEPSLPSPMRDATAAAMPDGRIALIGGGPDYGEPSGNVIVYDPTDGSATELPALPVAIENMPAVALPDGELLIFSRRASYSLAPGAAEWRVRKPIPGAYHAWFLGASAALGDDGLIYVAAGGRRIYVYDPSQDAWRHPIRLPVTTGTEAVAAADGAILVVTAARVWTYSTMDGEWAPGPARLRATSGTVGAHLLADGRLVVLTRDVLLGECSLSNVRLTVEVLDAARTRWAVGPARPSIVGAASAVSADRIFMLGGWLRTLTSDCAWSGTAAVAGVSSLGLASQ